VIDNQKLIKILGKLFILRGNLRGAKFISGRLNLRVDGKNIEK